MIAGLALDGFKGETFIPSYLLVNCRRWGVSWSNCGGGNIGWSCWWRWRRSGGSGGGRRGVCGGGGVVTTIIVSISRSAISVLLAAGGSVTTEAAKSLDNSGSDGLLEGSSPEHRHVVGGVGELEEDRQVVLGLRGGLAQGEEDERRADNLQQGGLVILSSHTECPHTKCPQST